MIVLVTILTLTNIINQASRRINTVNGITYGCATKSFYIWTATETLGVAKFLADYLFTYGG